MMKRQQPINKTEEQNKKGEMHSENMSCCNGKLFKTAQNKKSYLVFFITQFLLILHQILHFRWFSTKHEFSLIYFQLFFQFCYAWGFLRILTSNPGVVQKINYNYQIEKDLIQIPRNQHIKSHLKISYLIENKNMCCPIVLCQACNVYCPQRGSHCKVCGFCVQNFDHHSEWLGTCIGKSNYKTYCILILSIFCSYLIMVVMCIIILSQKSNNFINRSQIIPTAKQYPFTIILIVIAVPVQMFLLFKIILQSYLLANNLTFQEYKTQKWINKNNNPHSEDNRFKNITNLVTYNYHYRQLKLKYIKYITSSKTSSDSQKKDKSAASQGKLNSSIHDNDSVQNISDQIKANKNQQKQSKINQVRESAARCKEANQND